MPLPHTPRRSAFLKGAQLVVILEGDHNVSRAPPAPAEVPQIPLQDGFGDSYFNAKARIRPCLSYVCHVRSTAVVVLEGDHNVSRERLSETRVYEPQIRARLGTTAHLCKVVDPNPSILGGLLRTSAEAAPAERRFRATREQRERFYLRILKCTRGYTTLGRFLEEPSSLLVRPHRLLPERQGQYPALTVACVPCSLDSGIASWW